MSPQQKQTGFSLIELIAVIVLSGIIASITASVLTLPVKAYIDTARRATLVDIAESALRRMQRDIRRAVPNSIRVMNNGHTLELLHAIDGGRYRAQYADDGSGDILDFSLADNQFDVLGRLNNFNHIDLSSALLTVYPLTNPYHKQTITGLTTDSTASKLSFTAIKFPFPSPSQRFFIVDTPITYHCNLDATEAKNKVLKRYHNYPITRIQSLIEPRFSDTQANFISECKFEYNTGGNNRSALVSLTMRLQDDQGEAITLIHQVHIDNQL